MRRSPASLSSKLKRRHSAARSSADKEESIIVRHNIYLALGLIAIAFLSLPVEARRVQIVRAAAGSFQRRGAKAAVRAPLIREIDLEGLKKILQRDYKQSRPLLVNFWATYCEPCRDEFPDLVEIDKDFKGRGLEFITVSLDDSAEIKTSVPQFLRQMRAAMPAYLLNVIDPEPAIKWVDKTWGGALPATFLYDARGQVIFKHMGRVNPVELRGALEIVTGGR
jgi:thiol-disulfide isomerase/thioredoxin